MNFMFSWQKQYLTRSRILFLPFKHKIHIFSPPCNILYLSDLTELTLTAIYSGDYKWFESESEDELESDSPTGSPTHDRTPTPSETSGQPKESKENKRKGNNEVRNQLIG